MHLCLQLDATERQKQADGGTGERLFRQPRAATLPMKLSAEAGHDAEQMHDQCRAGGIVFQRVETDEGFNADLAQAELTAGRSRLQSVG